MNIIWHGQSFFEIAVKSQESDSGSIRIAIDPYNEEIGLRIPKVEANILLVSHQHNDSSNAKALTGNYFLIDNPGEYEIKDVFIKGIRAFHDQVEGKERGEVILYKIEAEKMRFCHLSNLGQKELSSEQLEQLGEVDILAIPIDGKVCLDAKGAAAVISQIEPRIVIPMHFKIPGLKNDFDDARNFLKVMGKEDLQPQPKLKITLKDLPKEETEVMLLTP